MVDHARAQRLAKRISTIVASAIEHDSRDPRLRFVTVTDAKVTGDLREATVYYTVMGETLDATPDYPGAADALERVRGKLRSTVGERTGIRYTPSLSFVLDMVPDTARHMEELLERVRSADAEVAKAREGATHAGDADPYKAAPTSADEDDE